MSDRAKRIVVIFRHAHYFSAAAAAVVVDVISKGSLKMTNYMIG